MNRVVREHIFEQGQRLQIVDGDITQENVDAIVNAANAHLMHGGGVAAAISRRGGPQIQAESSAWVRQYGPVTHAEPAYTHAGSLPSRYVIHAVGPIWGEGDEDNRLAEAVRGSLQRAEQLELTSIALPAISTGIFGFPKERAARLMLKTISAYFAQQPTGRLSLVRLVLYEPDTRAAFLQEWSQQGFG